MKAIKIYEYIQIYKAYILANQLEDDSDTISCKDLISFVDEIVIPNMETCL
jgi:hypothetical protein